MCETMLQIHNVHSLPFMLGGGVESPIKFSKKGALTGPQFLESDCW